jgi:uridine kinase
MLIDVCVYCAHKGARFNALIDLMRRAKIFNGWSDIFHGGRMWFEQIQRIAKLAQLRYHKDQLLVIAVDGCGGAGKTTLCQALAAEIEVWAQPQVLTLDRFYHPLNATQRSQLQHTQARQAYFDVTQFQENVLAPLSRGTGVSYKPYDWLEGETDQVVELLPKGVLLIDGVFSFSEPLRDMIHLSLFVDTPMLLRKQRLIARPQLDTDWVSHWQSTECWHHQHEQTADAVEFVLLGTVS